jgi:phospholipid/cholesterol/gamma-HCH transport system substrate-binding protein
MALQDLTPQLRTRMTRVERLVGLFVSLAALLMGGAFVYYLVHTGKNRGWFVNKVPYHCYIRDATGLKVGDPVRLLGREVGRIVEVETAPPDPWFLENNFNVFVKFEVWEPYFGYILTDSKVKVESADFFGSRYIEVTRGDPDAGFVTVIPSESDFGSSELIKNDKAPYMFSPDPSHRIPLRQATAGVFLQTAENPALAQRAQEIVLMISEAIPGITNQLATVLGNASEVASNATVAIASLQPILTNIASLTARMESEDGVIGRMLLPSDLQGQVEQTLTSMDATLTNTTSLLRTGERQMEELTRRLAVTLDNIGLVTSNLNSQVQANSLMLSEISSLVVSADQLLQGLQRHWLLRSAFGGAQRTNAPMESILLPSLDSVAPR